MIQFGTKAETLARLENTLTTAKILPQITFSVKEWRAERETIWLRACEKLKGYNELIVRSSAKYEDTINESRAGQYESVLNVSGHQMFNEAVDKVIQSFDKINIKDQVLVQPMLSDVVLCGVAFTLDPNTLGNYYVVNYDDLTGSTQSITSGALDKSKLFYSFKKKGNIADESMAKVCSCLKELEELFCSDKLDVEFAFNKKGTLYVFQVRPLCLRGGGGIFQYYVKNRKRL